MTSSLTRNALIMNKQTKVWPTQQLNAFVRTAQVVPRLKVSAYFSCRAIQAVGTSAIRPDHDVTRFLSVLQRSKVLGFQGA